MGVTLSRNAATDSGVRGLFLGVLAKVPAEIPVEMAEPSTVVFGLDWEPSSTRVVDNPALVPLRREAAIAIEMALIVPFPSGTVKPA